MKKLKSIIFYILSLIAIVILTMGIYILIVAIQEKLFVPPEYMMWAFKYPASRLVFIYELYLFGGLFYIFHKGFRKTLNSLFKKHRKQILSTFITFNIVLIYIITSAVTIITNNKIIDYSFLSPQGREYSYNDVVKVNTGVYGKKLYLPFTHSKGDFFYIIELDDGSKIDLAEVGGVKNDEHEYFIIEELDIQFVNMDIPKVSSMENFEYSTEHLDKIYTDKIRNILENTN
ncbi:hypothetical protein F9802_02705 [Bacillus aerolatus]|uniref:Uncharacterized protein n=1 Tax=Bacillus aerolatus TaxID=2653354 RepID=A0A6I1G0B0_9BACI|nr:hypothetical protein [Bacillus aerolatus]KAB7709056.1 hypothetical protein F9802_02705 [Bacillus aerolatus]